MGNKRFLLGMAGILAALASAGSVWAAEDGNDELVSRIGAGTEGVLFKIHDVKPIKNHEGLITDCEFNATFYNRSEKNVDNAVVELTWNDQAIADIIAKEKKEIAERSKRDATLGNFDAFSSYNQPQESETERLTPAALKASIRIPPLKPYRQISLKSKINSDRCFLMIEDAEFKLQSCSASVQGSSNVVSPTGSSCEGLFKFVSSKDPEYYREFKKVSFNEEKKNKQNARKKEQQDITSTYDKAVSEMSKATDIMGQIK